MEEGREGKILGDLTKKAVLNIFDAYFMPTDFDGLVMAFEMGQTFDTGADLPSKSYVEALSDLAESFSGALGKLGVGTDSPEVASAIEFVLEGLHLNRRLNRDQIAGGFRYRI